MRCGCGRMTGQPVVGRCGCGRMTGQPVVGRCGCGHMTGQPVVGRCGCGHMTGQPVVGRCDSSKKLIFAPPNPGFRCNMGADTKRQVRNPRKCPIRTRIARKTRFQSERSNPKPHVHAYTWITIHSQGCESVLKQACAGTPNRAGSLIAHPPFPPTCEKSTNRPFRTRWLAPHILTGIFFCFRTLSAAN